MAGSWTVTKRKLSGRSQVWSAFLLGHNEDGTWLYAAAGTPIRTGTGEEVGAPKLAGVQLIPTDDWWVAWWWDSGSITVDIATPADVGIEAVSYVDLELDLWADQHGGHGLVDHDEYNSARAAGLITGEQHRHASSAAEEVGRRLAGRVEPFGQVGWRWLSGVTRNELNVVAYDPAWPAKFRAARAEIMPLLPDGGRVEHVGSTSVPGLAAKDCLDIAVIVSSLDQFDKVIEHLEAIGYEARRAAFSDDPGHVFLRRLTEGRRSHHLHLYLDRHPNLIGVLAFRDLLRTDPKARARYEKVKWDLAQAAPYDRGGYIAGKNDIVQELVQTALTKPRPPLR